MPSISVVISDRAYETLGKKSVELQRTIEDLASSAIEEYLSMLGINKYDQAAELKKLRDR